MSMGQFKKIRQGQISELFHNHCEESLEIQKIGDISLKTGNLAVGDLMSLEAFETLNRSVMPGTYPCLSYIHHVNELSYVAFMEIRFNEKKPSRYVNAIGQSDDKKQEVGYEIYNQKGCIMDVSELKAYQHLDEQAMLTQWQNIHHWLNDTKVTLNPTKSIIAYDTGAGKGIFGVYFGLDRLGNICNVVTDFRNITTLEILQTQIDWGKAYDNGATHQRKIGQKKLKVDPLAGYNHLAIFLRWMKEHDLLSETLTNLVLELKQDMDWREIIDEVAAFDGKLKKGHFNELGNAFAKIFYLFNGSTKKTYPSCVDEYAKQYFGLDKYNSEEFQDEAYLFVPYDEAYYQGLSAFIDEAYQQFIEKGENEHEKKFRS